MNGLLLINHIIINTQVSDKGPSWSSCILKEFVHTMKNDEIGRSLFHLAICMSSMAITEATMALLMPTTKEKETISDGEENTESKPPPRKGIALTLYLTIQSFNSLNRFPNNKFADNNFNLMKMAESGPKR